MKTLVTLEKERLKKEKTKLIELQKSCNRTDIDELTKYEIRKRIEITKKAIDNLSDLVRQEIARNANLLFDGIQTALTHTDFRNLYYGAFEEFIENIASLEETVNGFERISNTAYNMDVQRAILYFGFTKNELETLLKNNSNRNQRNVFIAFFNKRYKTKIPTQRECEKRILDDEGTNIVEKEKNKYAYKKMILHNGGYMKDEYPQYYECELDDYYKELIKENKSILKRTRKHQ